MSEPPVERPDEDDQDLLTFGEAGVRVAEELAVERARLVALKARRQLGEPLDEDIEMLGERIAGLEDAATRNVASEHNFLTYEPVRPE